jgi:HD-GYP domain-containing protein (c-di-GMP phosphodiesterase class II)
MLQNNRGKQDKELINSFAALLKTVQIHNINNVAVTKASQKLLETLNELLSEGSATFDLVGEFFHLNGTRIRYSTDTMLNYNFLVNEFRIRELGSITFTNTLQDEDIKILLDAMIASEPDRPAIDVIKERLEKTPKITVVRLRKPLESNNFDRRKIVKKTYLNAVSLTKTISAQVAAGEKINIKKAKRVMEVIVDQILEEENTLIGMSTIKDYDEYTYFHSVNVSILAVALGQRLGLSKKTLTELGIAAIFHDLGKIEVPKEILNKPKNFTDEDWEIIHKHPAWGTCDILKIKGVNQYSITAAIVAFEHHLNYDLSGYPKIKSRFQLDLFSRIIAVVDNYDAMTSSRVYARLPLSPDKALSVLMEKSNSALDSSLVKIFVNMIGIYPIGTLVMLNTKEL